MSKLSRTFFRHDFDLTFQDIAITSHTSQWRIQDFPEGGANSRGGTSLLLPSAMKLQQSNVFTPVCHSVHRGVGVWQTPPCGPWADTTPPGRTPLGRYPLPGQTPPLGRHPPGQTPPRQTPPGQTPPLGRHPPPPGRWLLQWTVRILLEYILVQAYVSEHCTKMK